MPKKRYTPHFSGVQQYLQNHYPPNSTLEFNESPIPKESTLSSHNDKLEISGQCNFFFDDTGIHFDSDEDEKSEILNNNINAQQKNDDDDIEMKDSEEKRQEKNDNEDVEMQNVESQENEQEKNADDDNDSSDSESTPEIDPFFSEVLESLNSTFKIPDNMKTFEIIDMRDTKENTAPESIDFITKTYNKFIDKSKGTTQSDLILSLLLLFFSYNLTNEEISAITTIINIFFDVDLPDPISLIKRIFYQHCECFCVCEKCRIIYQFNKKKKIFSCPKCKKSLKKGWFHYYSIIHFLTEKMQDAEFVESVLFYKKRKKQNGISHFCDGNVFLGFKEKYFKNEQEDEINLALIFNGDGVETSKRCSTWPFFLGIANTDRKDRKKPLFNPMVAVCNKKRSQTVFQALLFLIVQDLLVLMKGIKVPCKIGNKNTFTLKAYLMCLVCDLPARAKFLLMKTFTGNSSCCFCDETGVSLEKPRKNGKKKKKYVCWPITPDHNIRMKDSIIEDAANKKNGFIGLTQLFLLPYFSPHIISGLDFMHCVLLGVAKKLLSTLQQPSPFRISPTIYGNLQNLISSIKFPANYHRKLESLKNLKAIEYLLLVLYANRCFDFIRNNFASLIDSLHHITKICFKPMIQKEDIEEVYNLSFKLRKEFQIKMGRNRMVHNLHLLSHISRDLALFGPSWTHSMFHFESFNHLLNKNIHTNNNFEKKILVCHSSDSRIWGVLEGRAKQIPELEKILKMFEKHRPLPKHLLVVNGCCVSTKDSSYTSWVELKETGERGQITLGENGKLFFTTESLFSYATYEIEEKDISEVKVQSYHVTGVDDDSLIYEKTFKSITPIPDLL